MIVDLQEFKIDDIILYDPYDDTENIIKIDISTSKNQSSILLRIEELTVLLVSEKNIMLSLKDKDYIKKFFNDIDAYFVSNIQERKIIKKLKLKFNYRQLLSGGDILNLNLNFDENTDFITQIYQNSTTKINHNNMISLLQNNGRASIILELKSIIFNKKEGIIYLDNVVRQMKIKKLKPKRLENMKYSFIDTEESSESSDNEEEIKNNKKSDKNNDDDCLIDNKTNNDTDSPTDMLHELMEDASSDDELLDINSDVNTSIDDD